MDETLDHVAAGRGISLLARSASVFYPHPEVVHEPIPDPVPDQVRLAAAASRVSPVVDDFFAAAQAAAEITTECGNHEMWRRGSDAVSKRGRAVRPTTTGPDGIRDHSNGEGIELGGGRTIGVDVVARNR